MKMADDNASHLYTNKKVVSLTNSSNVLISDKVISPNVENQYDLQWPNSQERDLTQIITEDTATNPNNFYDGKYGTDGVARRQKTEFKCPEVKKVLQKKSCISDENEISSNKYDSFFGHKPKAKFGKFKSLESAKSSGSNELQKISYWDAFSDEIILGIFSFLTKRDLCVCAKVCNKWRRLAYDESLWESLDLTGLAIREDILQHLFMRGVVVMRIAWLEVLTFEKIEKPDECDTECDQDVPYNVQYLDASSSSMKENVLLRCLSRCRNLKKLSLESCSVSNGILRAISNCDELSVLNMCMCSQINMRALKSIAHGCQRITELNLGWTNMTPESIALVQRSSLVVKSFPLLVKLNLSGCRDTLRDEAVTDLLNTCSNLTCLDVSDCIELSEHSVRSIVGHGKMKHLALSRCYGISPKILELLSSLKSLRSLQIFGFLTDPGLSILRNILKGIDINKTMFSSIARPTGSVYKQTIWGLKCSGPSFRDSV